MSHQHFDPTPSITELIHFHLYELNLELVLFECELENEEALSVTTFIQVIIIQEELNRWQLDLDHNNLIPKDYPSLYFEP